MATKAQCTYCRSTFSGSTVPVKCPNCGAVELETTRPAVEHTVFHRNPMAGQPFPFDDTARAAMVTTAGILALRLMAK